MGYRMRFIGLTILFFGLVCVALAEDYHLQYFLTKISSQTNELSKNERVELLNRIDEVMRQAKQIHLKLVQAIQTGEMEIRYQEGRFWMSKLEEDQEAIDSGAQQLNILREKPMHLVAAIKLYKSLKDLSFHFNTYNNMSCFSACIGDMAPEIELWVDPVFYKLYLLPLAQAKSSETKSPTKEKKPEGKGKKP